MIRMGDGTKGTPRQKAKELLVDAIFRVHEGYWTEGETGMTEREIEKVSKQIARVGNSLFRRMQVDYEFKVEED